jgi:hypothetical protein
MTTIKLLNDEILNLSDLDSSLHKHLEDGFDFIELAMNSHTLAFNELIKNSDIENCDSNYFMTQMLILGNKFESEFAIKCEEECQNEGFEFGEYLVLNVINLYQNRIHESGDFDDKFDINEISPLKHGIKTIDDLQERILELIVENSINLGIEKCVFSENKNGSINLTPKAVAPNEDNGFPFINFDDDDDYDDDDYDDDDDDEPPNYPKIEGELECQSIWSCEFSPNTLVKSGYTISIEHIWSHTDDGLTASKDISITLNDDCILSDALHYLEKEALIYVKSQGADYLRQYYIENVNIDDKLKTIEFGYGT